MRKKPIKIITLDTETYNGLIGELKRIAIYDGSKVHYGYTFYDIEPIITELSKRYQVHIYIHNLEFDFRKIYKWIKNDIIWEKCFIINDKLATVTTNNYIIHDSFKLLPMSLSSLSGKKGFNVEHGKLDLWEAVQERYPDEYTDIVDFLDRCDIDDSLYLEYLGYDVISLYEVLQELIKISGLSQNDFVKRVSTSSLSRFIFKKGYKGKQFIKEGNNKTDFEFLSSYNWRNNLEIEEFIRASYCGGRTEVFKPKLETKGFHYDVNSLYPSVMINGLYPIGKPDFSEEPEVAEKRFTDWLEFKRGLGFLCCEIYIPYQHIPPLPVKMGKLAFPCGMVYGTWSYEELEYAIKNCGCEIKKYYAVCHFKNTYPVFKNFIETFYQLKEQATIEKNYALRTFAKLLMNVGYGYTGMKREGKTSLISINDVEQYENVKFVNNDLGYAEIPSEINAEYIQVQIASYVTSRARLVLLKALRHAEEQGANVYYCDTDSIVTDKPFNSAIVDGSKLGFWDLESEPDKALFLRPKVYAEMYAKDVNVKFKGISKETQKNLQFDDYEHLYNELEEMKKDFEIIEKNRTTFRSVMYMTKNDIDMTYYEIRDKKMNFKTIEKRKMNYIGNYTKPYFFKTVDEFDNFSFTKPLKSVSFDDLERVNNDK